MTLVSKCSRTLEPKMVSVGKGRWSPLSKGCNTSREISEEFSHPRPSLAVKSATAHILPPAADSKTTAHVCVFRVCVSLHTGVCVCVLCLCFTAHVCVCFVFRCTQATPVFLQPMLSPQGPTIELQHDCAVIGLGLPPLSFNLVTGDKKTSQVCFSVASVACRQYFHQHTT